MKRDYKAACIKTSESCSMKFLPELIKHNEKDPRAGQVSAFSIIYFLPFPVTAVE